MNRSTSRSTRALLRAAALTPAALLLAATGAAAHADTGPVASIVNGPLQTIAGQTIPMQTADLTHPHKALPSSVTSPDGLLRLAKGIASVNRVRGGAQEAVAKIGQGTLRTKGSGPFHGMAFTGISAKCLTTATGGIDASTTLDHAKLLGSKTLLPVHPRANYRVPTTDPGLNLVLNKQITDPTGGKTVTAVSLDSTTSGLRELGVAHCAPLLGHAAPTVGRAAPLVGHAAAPLGVHRAPASGHTGRTRAVPQRAADNGPSDTVLGQVRSLTNTVTSATKALPGTNNLPSLPATLPQRASRSGGPTTLPLDTAPLPVNLGIPSTGALAPVSGLPVTGALPSVPGVPSTGALLSRLGAPAKGVLPSVGGVRSGGLPSVPGVPAPGPLLSSLGVPSTGTLPTGNLIPQRAENSGLSGLLGGLPGLSGLPSGIPGGLPTLPLQVPSAV